MAVKIRLSRRGRKKLAMFDVVVSDARAPRDGRFIEKLGTYNPNTNPATVVLNEKQAIKDFCAEEKIADVMLENAARKQIRDLIKLSALPTRDVEEAIKRNAAREHMERKDIEIAFRWKKPAVISTHRVNYVGSIDPKNRQKGLGELKRLISLILKKWPDVEFMSSSQLGDLISNSLHK